MGKDIDFIVIEFIPQDFLYLLKFVMGKIFLNSIRLYAFHGCMDEESRIGSDYIVDIVVDTNLSLSSNSDNLSDTVDYVTLHDLSLIHI